MSHTGCFVQRCQCKIRFAIWLRDDRIDELNVCYDHLYTAIARHEKMRKHGEVIKVVGLHLDK